MTCGKSSDGATDGLYRNRLLYLARLTSFRVTATGMLNCSRDLESLHRAWCSPPESSLDYIQLWQLLGLTRRLPPPHSKPRITTVLDASRRSYRCMRYENRYSEQAFG